MASAVWALALLVSTASRAADAPTRLDPALRMAMQEPVISASLTKRIGLKAAVGELPVVELFVKTTDVVEAEKIIAHWGGVVRTVAGRILTASLPLAYVEQLSQTDIIEYVEASRQLRHKLNQSLAIVDIDDVHAGTGLGTAYTGAGVLLGIVDSGLDCDHADWNDGSGVTRLLAYWDQTTGSSGVSEIQNSTGTEYTGSSITNGSCTSASDSDSTGHGTHVAGIAVSNDTTYTGAAPGAKIIAVKHNAQSAETDGSFATVVVDAVNYIFRKAQAQSPKLPAVVNLSLGSSLGAHDGTSLFEQSLDALLEDSGGSDKKGRAIVGAAGNENLSSADTEAATFGGIHATVSQTSTEKAFDFVLRSASTIFTTFGGAQIDVWLDSTSNCTVQLDAYAHDDKAVSALKVDMSPVTKGNSTTASANTDGSIQIALDFTDSTNANNGKQHALATITKVTGASVNSSTYSFDLLFIGSCTGDAWLYPDLTAALAFRKVSALPSTTSGRGYAYVDGDSDRTMTIPATGKKIIAVGSFMGAGTWTDLNGSTHDQTSTSVGTGGTAGAISLFSSLGPTPDGRTKPDLTAPGEPIIATLASTVSASSSRKGDATHHKLEGSSMAAPHVTGTIALMLERNGCLTPTAIKSALTNNASSDSTTGTSLPDNTYGAGKLDADAAVASVTAASCEPDNTDDNGVGTTIGTTTSTTSGTSTTGGGSCALLPTRLDSFRVPQWVGFLIVQENSGSASSR